MVKKQIYLRHGKPFLKIDWRGDLDIRIAIKEIAYLRFCEDLLKLFGAKSDNGDPIWEESDLSVMLNGECSSSRDALERIWNDVLSKIIPVSEHDKLKETLAFLGKVDSDKAFGQFRKKYEPLAQKCGLCGRFFLASRRDSAYCDKCRNKVHVRNSRDKAKKQKITPNPVMCACGCGREIISRTQRARFYSDACRVRANRRKDYF